MLLRAPFRIYQLFIYVVYVDKQKNSKCYERLVSKNLSEYYQYFFEANHYKYIYSYYNL